MSDLAALVAIGIIVDANRLIGPQIPEGMTNNEQADLKHILAKMMQVQEMAVTTTGNSTHDGGTPRE